MTSETAYWLIILTAITAPLAWLVWTTRARPVQPPAVSANAEFDLHVADTPPDLLTDRRPSWNGEPDHG